MIYYAYPRFHFMSVVWNLCLTEKISTLACIPLKNQNKNCKYTCEISLALIYKFAVGQVRAAGLGIAVALTMNEAGRITMTTQCQHIAGGIWGVAFSILLDQSECSLVRQEAALLLLNLTSQKLPNGSEENAADSWQGPVVHNEDTQVSITVRNEACRRYKLCPMKFERVCHILPPMLFPVENKD